MITNRSLLLPYAVPYLAYVGIASVLGDLIPVEFNYLLRIILCSCLLAWAWKWYIPLSGPKSTLTSVVVGIPAGFAGLLIWIVLLTPFTPESDSSSWSATGFLLRLTAATLLVPVIEEVLMRGFIFRLAHQWWEERKKKQTDPLVTALDERSVNEALPDSWSWMAVLVSTLVFVIGHHLYEWPAAAAYGLLMASLLILRKDLVCCITAHAVTNLSLALYVAQTGSYHLW